MSRIRCFNATGSTLRDWYSQVERGNRTTSQARLALTPKHSINPRASSLNRAGLKAFFESPPATCDGPGSSPPPSASDDGSHPPAPSTGVPPKGPAPPNFILPPVACLLRDPQPAGHLRHTHPALMLVQCIRNLLLGKLRLLHAKTSFPYRGILTRFFTQCPDQFMGRRPEVV